MIYDIKAIPTKFNGVEFRSRLEARWAAFFDLCGWEWEYEPFDLDGWTPDFSIKKYKGGRVLIEVKPFDFVPWEDAHGNHGKVADAYSKVMRHVDSVSRREIEENSVLLLGASPFHSNKSDAGYIGMHAHSVFDTVSFRNAGLCSGYGKNAGLDVVTCTGGVTHSVEWEETCPKYGGTLFIKRYWPTLIKGVDGSEVGVKHRSVVEKLWREAGNKSQWKPKG